MSNPSGERPRNGRHEVANPFPFLMFGSTARNFFKDLGGPAISGDVRTPQPTRAEEEVDPYEAKRQELMDTLPLEQREALGTFPTSDVRQFIADVATSRRLNPERTDWDIHILCRRAIETEEPHPLRVQRTQISGVLLEGTRGEAHYPF